MSESNTISAHDAVQINKALEVLNLLVHNPRMTQEKACANVGISQPTYRKWIATQEDALISFEQARTEIERNEFSLLLISKSAITSGLVKDAMKPNVSVTERIKALDYVEKRMDELSDRYHTVDVQAEQDLLSGPKQLPGESRLANRVSVTEDNNTTIIKIKDKPAIIDILEKKDQEEL